MNNDLSDIRQTYIIMFEKNGMRYIFNRSVRWNSILSTKNIDKLVKLLGKDAINNFILLLNDTENTLCDKVTELTNHFIIDESVFTVLEVHPEWENVNRKDQYDKIDPRKKELCKQYNAAPRKDLLSDSNELDKYLAKSIKKQFKQWLIKIYDAIIEYAHIINDEIVHTSIGATTESLRKQYDELHKQYVDLVGELNRLHEEIRENKKKLRKQNYVIEAYNRYLNNLDDDEIEQIKNIILYGANKDTSV